MTIIGKEITPKLLRKILGFSVLGLLVVGVLVYFGLIWREKAQFAQAEKEIDALYAQIVERVGKPDQEKKEKSCDRPNLKYKKGPLSCSVTVYALYDNSDFVRAGKLMSTISSLSSSALRPGSATTIGQMGFVTPDRTNSQVFFQSVNLAPGLSCSISYDFAASQQDEFTLSGPSGVEIGVGCNRSAILEYFPMKN